MSCLNLLKTAPYLTGMMVTSEKHGRQTDGVMIVILEGHVVVLSRILSYDGI